MYFDRRSVLWLIRERRYGIFATAPAGEETAAGGFRVDGHSAKDVRCNWYGFASQ
jgi:hypothetical protein